MSLQNTTHLDRIKELLSDTKRQLDAASSSVFDLERSMAPIVEATQRRRKAASHMAMAIDELRQLCVHLRVADQAELRLCEWYLFNRSAMFFSTAAKLKESSAYLDAFVGGGAGSGAGGQAGCARAAVQKLHLARRTAIAICRDEVLGQLAAKHDDAELTGHAEAGFGGGGTLLARRCLCDLDRAALFRGLASFEEAAALSIIRRAVPGPALPHERRGGPSVLAASVLAAAASASEDVPEALARRLQALATRIRRSRRFLADLFQDEGGLGEAASRAECDTILARAALRGVRQVGILLDGDGQGEEGSGVGVLGHVPAALAHSKRVRRGSFGSKVGSRCARGGKGAGACVCGVCGVCVCVCVCV